MDVEVGPLGAAEVEQRAAEVGEVYRAAFAAEEPVDDAAVERFLREQLAVHRDRDGFRLVAATTGGRLVGFAYGCTGAPGQWWTDRLTRLAPEVAAAWAGGHFEVVELAVHPDVQGRGLGRRLMEALVDGLPHGRALLSTYVDDRAATRLYRRLGWEVLVPRLEEDVAVHGLRLPPP